MSESARIAEQLRRAFEGDAWHGDSVLEILEGVDASAAAARPIASAHSIWELLLHVAAWDDVVRRRLGSREAITLSDAENFPGVHDLSAGAWDRAVQKVVHTHRELVRAVEDLPDARLTEHVPGKDYDIRFMLHGVVQHELYHAGQIALLKKAAARGEA
jgi:uncharacterized damage-inducible protein DinB